MARTTALITGASMGLGAEYARLCAEAGMDLVLVARSRDKLERLAEELSSKHRITAHVLPIDLDRREAAHEVKRAVDALDLSIDVLVNNAGFGTSGAFLENPLPKELSMVHVNVETVVALTHLFAGPMVERGRGRVLLVASTAGFVPCPGTAVYCATKAFVLSFGDALAFELRGTGVSVTTHCPGATATEFARTSGNEETVFFQQSALVATSASCAADGFRAMQRGRSIAVHGFFNWLTAFFGPKVPRAIVLRIGAFLVGFKSLGKSFAGTRST